MCPSSQNVPHIWITTWTHNGANYPESGPNWSIFQANSIQFITFCNLYKSGLILMGHDEV